MGRGRGGEIGHDKEEESRRRERIDCTASSGEKKKGGEEGEKKGEGERISLLNIVSRFIDRPVR